MQNTVNQQIFNVFEATFIIAFQPIWMGGE